MKAFNGKKIILGITGGIAAYKSVLLLRELIKQGAEVKVVMTPSAAEFISPLTFSTLSKHPVIVNTFSNSSEVSSTWHVDYALWADLMIIAPATINTIAKINFGFADNALTTLVTALRSPLIIAPAADVDMYRNPITQKNINELESKGFYIVPAEKGELASGLTGFGRLADTEKILLAAQLILNGYKKDLVNKKILVTAGPTFEDIDPVRYIGNRSSGKMGYMIAKAAFLRGASVTLISGPSNENIFPEIETIAIRSASEMNVAVNEKLKLNDILIMAAAVADYKPSNFSNKKLKKENHLTEIKLTPTIDVLSSLSFKGKIIIGFALETENEIENARKKLLSKKMDMIVLNSLKEKDSGFEYDTNRITIITKTSKPQKFPLLSKFLAANAILSEIKKI